MTRNGELRGRESDGVPVDDKVPRSVLEDEEKDS